ncbi:hypothetical protein GV829_01140 [Sphingomonas lacunae]|uniref:Metal-dependent hydrolase n=1 Tax=Sphingomonas lacunae TaxID=2698828 RepID=A0A6M4AQC7_9SPHN|nr:hypothetical protein [Sphingomonas lacunae]QJQ31217.1 hypothetical protein GV829_01140 [Sphingomonas lacunae]
MFIGHWAPALVAAAHPKAPGLGTLFIAGQLVDWGFFSLMLLGVEDMRVSPGISVMNPMDLYHMPWTHSLVGSVVWAAGFAFVLWLWRQDRIAAMMGGAVVLSHWFLDLIVHVPDLTLWGSPPKLGLGLWNHPDIAMPLELGITLAALLYYSWKTRAIGVIGRIGPALLGLLLLSVQMINWFGEEATEVSAAIPLTALAAYGVVTLVAWAIDQQRRRTAA